MHCSSVNWVLKSNKLFIESFNCVELLLLIPIFTESVEGIVQSVSIETSTPFTKILVLFSEYE